MAKVDPKIAEVKTWLSSYVAIQAEIEELELEIERLDTKMNRLTSTLSLSPKGNTASIHTKWTRAIAKKDKAKRRIVQYANSLCDRLEEIVDAIDTLENPYEKTVMTLRYIRGMRWDDIVKKFEGLYSLRSVHYLHQKAVSRIELPKKYAGKIEKQKSGSQK